MLLKGATMLWLLPCKKQINTNCASNILKASSVEDEQDLGLVEIPKAEDEISKDTGVGEWFLTRSRDCLSVSRC